MPRTRPQCGVRRCQRLIGWQRSRLDSQTRARSDTTLTYRVLLERSTIYTIGQLGSILGEVWETSDRKVFLVRIGFTKDVLSLRRPASAMPHQATECKKNLFHRSEDVRFSITVPIRANTKVDLLRVFVGLKSFGDT